MDTTEDIEIARQVLQDEANALMNAAGHLGREVCKAADLLMGTRGKVVCSGMGKSGIVARKVSATLASTGTPSIFIHPVEAMHGDLGAVQADDVGLLISNSGEIEELLQVLQYFKRVDVRTISIVGRKPSTLAEHSDVCLFAGVEREACPLNLAPTASTTVAMALGDALAVVLMHRRGFSASDYAKLHPCGSLGRRLLLRVSDAMHSGQENPSVPLGRSMREAIVEITSKGMGAVSVVDNSGKLVGIITDGDLRRALHRDGDVLQLNVDDIMTTSPVRIREDKLAVEAVALMENRPSQIAVLPVVDASEKAVGIIRLHDLVKAGLY